MLLEVRGLSYTYPGARQSTLHDLEFAVGEGEIFGFLGPNGAGKSTTQKILTGILTGYRGELRVFGQRLGALGRDYYNRVGVSFKFPNLYDRLTAEENLDFYRRFFDGPTEDPAELLGRFDLPVGERKTAGQYSKGMKMRLVLARSMINRPRLWFLDEPTAGQDPQHSVRIREMIRQQREQGTTVFLTTHNMTVADELCDRVAFIVEGRIAAIDSPRRLKLQHGRKVARVEYSVDGTVERRDFDLEDVAGKTAFLDLVRDHAIETIHTQEPSLEDVFLKVTGRSLTGA